MTSATTAPTTPPADGTTQDWFDGLVGELADVQARKQSLADREEQIKDLLRQIGAGDYRASSGLTVRVTQRRQVTEDIARQVLTDSDFERCFSARFDAKSVRQVMSPDAYDQHAVPVGKPSVSLT